MKANYFFLILIMVFASCEKPSDCFESAGSLNTKAVEVSEFSSIVINHGIAAEITQDSIFSVLIEAPENLISDIEVEILDGILKISDKSTCNFTRKYGLTTIKITAPNLTEIHSQTEKNISSKGVLSYPSLALFSTDFGDGVGTGDFVLELNSNNLSINTNNVSGFYISGQTENLVANFYEGNGILRAKDLVVENAEIFQRSSNHLHLKASQSLTGKILSTGNVFCYGIPNTVEVEQPYIGKLIYQ